MAISAGSTLYWSDMSSLFSRISTQRQKFGYGAINPSSYGGVGTYARSANIQNMKDLLVQIRGNGYATAVVDRFSIPVPAVGSIIFASNMTPIIGLIGALESTCVFDGFSFNSCHVFDNFGFGFNSCHVFDNFGFGFNSCHVFDNFGFGFHSCNGFNSFNGFSTCSYFNTSFTFNSFGSCSPYQLGFGFS